MDQAPKDSQKAASEGRQAQADQEGILTEHFESHVIQNEGGELPEPQPLQRDLDRHAPRK